MKKGTQMTLSANRLKWMCTADVASRKVAIVAAKRPKRFRTSPKKSGTVAMPTSAEGNRIASIVGPIQATNGARVCT